MRRLELVTPDGHRFLLAQKQVRLGRDPKNNICIRDEAVSREHLSFEYLGEQWFVSDLGSQNGYGFNGLITKNKHPLQHGDRIVLGRHTYTIVEEGQALPLPDPSKNTQSRIRRHTITAQAHRTTSNSRPLVLAIGIAAILGALWFADQTSKTSPNQSTPQASPPSQGLPSQSYLPPKFEQRSENQILAEARFREGLRDYENMLYSRSLLLFQEAASLNPTHSDAQLYIQFSKQRIATQLETLHKEAHQAYLNMQYRLSKLKTVQILTILSDEVAGFARKIATEFIQPNDGRTTARYKTQDHLLLELPCNNTSFMDLCEKSKDILRRSRQSVGEEDVIR